MSDAPPPDERPALRVVRGEPTREEVAALVTVVAARAAATAAGELDARPAIPGWNDRTPQLRKPIRPGPGAWRASSRTG